jgi:3-isopropylmalate/(R)-2-methylmalate dehydratase large subunit
VVKAVEKILARASGSRDLSPGDVVITNVDRVIMHDQSAFMTSRVFEEQVGKPLRDPDRAWVVFDHNFAPATLKQAQVIEHDRTWVAKHGVNLSDCGGGQIHNVVHREAGIRPGMIVVGSDSHTSVHGVVGAFAVGVGNNSIAGSVFPYSKAWFRVPESIRVEIEGRTVVGTTPRDVALWLAGQIGEGAARYKAVEFEGDYMRSLPFWDRWLFPLLGVDIGAKSCFVRPDDVTRARLTEMGLDWLDADDPLLEETPASEFDTVWTYDVSELGPQVACPPTVGNVKPVEEVVGTPIQWAEVGGHGGGRLEDIRLLDAVLRRYPKHKDVRVNVVPSSREVFTQALEEGLVASLFRAGATWFPPSTGSNQAVNMGAMTASESMISTHSRNFPGRNGDPASSMYLSSALTVAASAVQGAIADPRELDLRDVLS